MAKSSEEKVTVEIVIPPDSPAPKVTGVKRSKHVRSAHYPSRDKIVGYSRKTGKNLLRRSFTGKYIYFA